MTLITVRRRKKRRGSSVASDSNAERSSVPSYSLVAERRLKRKVGLASLKSQVCKCVATAMAGPRGQGWTSSLSSFSGPIVEGDDLLYRAVFKFSPTSNRQSLFGKWENIVKRFAKAGSSGMLQSTPWQVVFPEGYSEVSTIATNKNKERAERKMLADEPRELGKVNLIRKNEFDRIYGRDAQINRIFAALELAEREGWNKRIHSLMDGPPGCGKTEILQSFAKMLGNEGEAYLWFDATSTTRAGAIEQLMEAVHVPPVLLIEEIEKCEEQALRWLLGVMDIRGQIRRTNYRVGNQARHVKMVVIATANDVNLLKTVMSGALYSRFQSKVYCPRPDRDIMRLILQREMKDINGKDEWIEESLKFAMDKWGMTDPRDVITICSLGGDRLLDGSFQKDYELTMHPVEVKELLENKEK